MLGSKDKDNTYVKGRLKLLFRLVGDGGSKLKNDCRVEDFDLPMLKDTTLDYLIYGLARSNLKELRVDDYGFLPFARFVGKKVLIPLPPKEDDEEANQSQQIN